MWNAYSFQQNIANGARHTRISCQWPLHVLVFHPALLPQQKQNELIRLERRAELHERQALYKWGQRALFEGLPGFIDASKPSDLPRDSQSPGNAAGESESNDVFTKLFSWFESWNDLNAFRKIPEEVSGKIPKCADGDKWMEDRIFGMQFLNGCNPGIIRRCNKLPGNFPVTDGDVSAQLSRGLKLQQEIEVGVTDTLTALAYNVRYQTGLGFGWVMLKNCNAFLENRYRLWFVLWSL